MMVHRAMQRIQMGCSDSGGVDAQSSESRASRRGGLGGPETSFEMRLDCGREVTGVEQPLNQGGERSAGLDGKVCRSLSPDKGERQVLAQFEEWKVSRAHCSDLQLHTIQRL